MGYIIGAIVLAIGLKFFFESDNQASASGRPAGSSPSVSCPHCQDLLQ
jgi:hypothetical protein